MKGELSQGLRNAIERGASIEQAAQSFISAGYSQAEVYAAANSLNDAASQLIPTQQAPADEDASIPPAVAAPESQPSMQQYSPTPVASSPSPMPAPTAVPSSPAPNESGVSKGKIILLIAVLVILLGLLGASFIFKSQIASMFGA